MVSERGLFGLSRSKLLAKVITIRSPTAAKDSVTKLNKLFNRAKRRDTRVKIARSANQTSNRARASLNRKNLSRNERRQMRAVAKIYRRASDRMFARLRKEKK